jgi:hypothetical protein
MASSVQKSRASELTLSNTAGDYERSRMESGDRQYLLFMLGDRLSAQGSGANLGVLRVGRTTYAFLLKWITIWGHKKEYAFVGCLYVSYSKLMYERLDEAEAYINQVLGRKDMEPFARKLIQILISVFRIQQAALSLQQGSPKDAMDWEQRWLNQRDTFVALCLKACSWRNC